MHQAEEDLLVLAAQDGSKKAFNIICQRYHKPLLHYAFKVCNDWNIAEDAVQEAWIKFAKGIRRLKDPRALRSWLYRLVRWSSIDLVRAAKKNDHYQLAFVEEELKDKKAEEDTEAKSDLEELKRAIDRLPGIEKQMIHLFYLDELKVNEISSVLEVPAGTVKSRLNRARKMLKDKFEC